MAVLFWGQGSSVALRDICELLEHSGRAYHKHVTDVSGGLYTHAAVITPSRTVTIGSGMPAVAESQTRLASWRPGSCTIPSHRRWSWPHGVFGSAGRGQARGKQRLTKSLHTETLPWEHALGKPATCRKAWAGQLLRRKGEKPRQTRGHPAHPGLRAPRMNSDTAAEAPQAVNPHDWEK